MYHLALVIKIPVLSTNILMYNEKRYNFINCDYSRIKSNLAEIYWDSTFKDLCINKTVNVFYKNIFNVIHLSCPNKYVYSTNHP